MGRVTNQSQAATAEAAPPSSTLKHFTHPHELHPLPFYSPQSLCSGCKLQSSGVMYTCAPCKFTLHQPCAKLPQLITHPSHGGCTLSLLAVSSYPGGIFSCNACGRGGDSWNYHCARCEYDLHVSCASKPLKISHQAHGSCELELTFKNPYANSSEFSCDICRKVGSKQWLYRCNSCEFDVHLDCTAAPRPVLQHLHSAPSAPAPPYPNPNAHSQFPASPHAAAQVSSLVGQPQPAPVPHLTHSASTGAIGNPYSATLYHQGPVNPGQTYGSWPGNPQVMTQNNQTAMETGLGGNMMAAAFQGIVEGAFQGIGQAVVQEFVGGGGVDGSGGGGGGGGDVSSY